MHSLRGLTREVVGRVAAWRSDHDVEMVLVRGNHDRRLELPPAWRMALVESHLDLGPFRFSYHPEPAEGRYVWAVHLHPTVRLDTGADRLRLPCFHLGVGVGVLPAFSAFTGGQDIRPRADERLFAIAEDTVVEVPPPRASHRPRGLSSTRRPPDLRPTPEKRVDQGYCLQGHWLCSSQYRPVTRAMQKATNEWLPCRGSRQTRSVDHCRHQSAYISDHTYIWSAPYSGTFTFTTFGSSYDTVLSVFNRSNSAAMACNDDFGGTLQSSVTLSVLAGQQVGIVVDGYGGACGSFSLNISAVSQRLAFYRYYNTGNGDHFYTTNWGELGSGGGRWVYEGVAGYVPTSSAFDTANFYRYYNTGNGDHFYTTNWSELGSGGGRWVYEGVACPIYTRP